MRLQEVTQPGLGRGEHGLGRLARGRERLGRARALGRRRRCRRLLSLAHHGLEMVVVRPHDDLVVNVGDVHHVEEVETKVVEEHAAHDVEGHVVARVAHVSRVVHGRAAHVPLDEPRVDRREGLDRLSERVEEVQALGACSARQQVRRRVRARRRRFHQATLLHADGRAQRGRVPPDAQNAGDCAARKGATDGGRARAREHERRKEDGHHHRALAAMCGAASLTETVRSDLAPRVSDLCEVSVGELRPPRMVEV